MATTDRMANFRAIWLVISFLAAAGSGWISLPIAVVASAATQTSDDRTISRYLLLLEKRPTAGTAFDRVFNHYDQNGRLDDLIQRLQQSTTSEQVTAARQILLGMVYVRNMDSQLAIDQLQLARVNRPTDPLINDQIARAWMLQSEFAKAAAAWELAFDQTTSQTASLKLAQQLSSVYGKLRQSDQALAVLAKFDEQFPGEPEIQNLLTRALLDAGRTDEAVQKLKDQLANTTSTKERLKIKTQLADLMLKAGRDQEAITAYKSISEGLNPESWQAQELDQKLQQLLAKQPDQQALETYLTQRLQVDSTSLSKRLDLMRFLSRTGRHEESLQVAEKATGSQQDAADLLRMTIPDHLALRQYDQTDAAFQRLEVLGNLVSDDIVRWGQIALDHSDSGRDPNQRKVNAVEIWKKLLTLADSDTLEWQRRATLAKQLAAAGMPGDAISQYGQAIASNKPSPDVFVDYAELLVQQGQAVEAVATLRQLVSRSTKSTTNVRLAIDALRNFNQIDAAVKFATQLVQREDTSESQLILAELLLLQNDFTSADQHLNLVLTSASAAQRKVVRQQLVDLLLKTGFVAAKFQQLQSEKSLDATNLLLLAQLAEVQGELTVGLQTLQKLPASSAMWISAKEMQARLQHKAGQLHDAEATFQTLISLATKKTFEYQEAIQNLQLQMGRSHDAYQTAQALFQTAPQSASAVSRYVDFLKNSDRHSKAISVLDAFLQQQSSSAIMMVELGDLLAEQFRSDEAMKWYWKAMGLSTSETLQRDIATRLVVLALRTNQTSVVLQRLKSTVNQNSAASTTHRTLLMVDAYRQARQLTDAVRELESFLQTEAGNVAVLTELVDLLSKLDRKGKAIKYQFQLARLEPTSEVFRRLSELLYSQSRWPIPSEVGTETHETELLQLTKSPGWPDIAIELVDQLIDSERRLDALGVLRSLKGSHFPQWKTLIRETYLMTQGEKPDSGLAKAKAFISSPISTSDLLRIAMIDNDSKLFQARTFAGARVMTGRLLVSHFSEQESLVPDMMLQWKSDQQRIGSDKAEPIALAELSIILHRGAFLTAAEMRNVATQLADLDTENGDLASLSILLAIKPPEPGSGKAAAAWDSANGRFIVGVLEMLQAIRPEEVSQDIIQLAHRRLVESDLPKEAQILRRELMPRLFANRSEQLPEYWQIAESSKDLAFANLLLDHWATASTDKRDGTVKWNLPDNFGRSLALFCSLANVQERSQLLQKFLLLKARSGESSRGSASGDGRSFEIRWTNKTSHRLFEDGRHIGSRNVVTLPANSQFEMTDVTFLVNLLHGLSDSDQRRLSDVAIQLADQQKQPASRVIHRLTSAHLLCLQSNFDEAILQLIDAAEANPTMGSLRVLIAAYHAENGHALSALNLLETIPSSDVVAYQQALWLKLRIGGSSGQLAVADQAARSLLGTRLTQDERRHLALITKSRQLAVEVPTFATGAPKDARPMEALANQMQQMQKDNQIDKAIEIANSILLTSDATQHSTSMANSARRSAVSLLAQHNQLNASLIDVERRLKQNANSTDLLRLKLQILSGMNQTLEAEQVQQQLAKLVPESPEELIQVARDFEEERRFSEAAETYLKAFRAKPSLLLADYYRYFKVFRRIDRLPEVATLLIESDLRQLRDNYFVVSELIDILLSQSDATELGRRSIDSGFNLLSAAWRAFPSDRDYLLNNIQAKRLWESQVVVDFICDSLVPESRQQAFARPWLGLDSKPVQVEGKDLLCPLQRVLLYLKNEEARDTFLQRVIAGQKQFPEWQAGPYIEVALTFSSQRSESARRELVNLIDSAVADELPPVTAAVNTARILQGKDRVLDGSLARLVEAATTGARTTSRNNFATSTDRLLAQLQFSAGDLASGRRTVLRAIQKDSIPSVQQGDPKAAWNRIQSVLSAVELLRSSNLVLDAVTVSKQVTPQLLTASRGFQSNDSLDRACQRMWQQARQTVQSTRTDDVLVYLRFQMEDKDQSVEWDLQLNPPSWSDRISWQNSDLISILQRIGKSNPDQARGLAEKLQSVEGDQLSASLCRLALQSETGDPAEYLSSVQRFVNQFSDSTGNTPAVSKNAVLAWCLVNSFRNRAVNNSKSPTLDEDLILQVLNLALRAGVDRPEAQIWKHCILNEAAEMLQARGNSHDAADAWSQALDTLIPPSVQQQKTDRSPLKETRRLLLGP